MSVDFRLVINFHSCLFSVSNNMICWFVVTLSSGRTDGGRAGFVGSWYNDLFLQILKNL